MQSAQRQDKLKMATCWKVCLLVAMCLRECYCMSTAKCEDPSTGEITSAGQLSVNAKGMQCYCPEEAPVQGQILQPYCAFLEASTKPIPGCLVEGKQYAPDEWFQPNPCRLCHCDPQERTAECMPTECFPAPCPNPSVSMDNCCPYCPNGPACLGKGGDEIPAGKTVIYSDGTQCTCSIPRDPFSTETVIDLTPVCIPPPPIGPP